MTAPSGWADPDTDDLWSPFLDGAADQGVSIDDLKSFSANDLDAAADEFLAARKVPAMRCGALKSALRQWAVMVSDIELLPLENGTVVKVFLSKKLGIGGQADVFAGKMCPDGPQVAVKRVLDPAVGEKEHKMLRSLKQCPQIVSQIAMVRHRGSTWLVMEAVDGGTVAEHLSLCGPMSEDAAAEVALDVLRALAHAAKNGVIHRDVKPQNMLLSNGVTKLTDFGLARHDQSVTSQSGLKGTPIYMSSKALHGHFSHASDLHAVGVSVVVMLSGTEQVFAKSVPYPYEPHFAVTTHITEGGKPQLPTSNSQDAQNFIMACLEGGQAASKLMKHPWVVSRSRLSEIVLPERRLLKTRSSTYTYFNTRPPTANDDLRRVRVQRYLDSREVRSQRSTPCQDTSVNTIQIFVRDFLHKGWNMKTSTVDALINALNASHAIDSETLRLSKYSDDFIEQFALDIFDDPNTVEITIICLRDFRSLLQQALQSEKNKVIDRLAQLFQKCAAKQMRPWWTRVKHLAERERKRRQEIERRQKELARQEQERRAEEMRLQQAQQRRANLQSRVQRIYNEHVGKLRSSNSRRAYVRGSDFDDVMSALEMHPNSRRKIGCGVRSIFVANTSFVASPCFHVERRDGSVEDFSYRKCLELDCWPRQGYDYSRPGRMKPKYSNFFDEFDDF